MPLVLLVGYNGKIHEGEDNNSTENAGFDKMILTDFQAKILYDSFSCQELDYEIFSPAIKGHKKLKQEHIGIVKDVITVIDIDKPLMCCSFTVWQVQMTIKNSFSLMIFISGMRCYSGL